MSVKRFTFDTNVLIYAVDHQIKSKHERAVSLLKDAMHLDCVLTLQALCEFYAAATRKKYMSHDDASCFIQELAVLFPVIAASNNALPLALKAVEIHQLSFWDAMLWATAKENKCSFIISEDFQDRFTSGEVVIKNPFQNEEPLSSLIYSKHFDFYSRKTSGEGD